ncbi:MAG: hypothetical protein NTZ05_05150, partial [Chloroflexi bacterium]|nr:hypothetical protein [Chloroflexota bacterium]
MGTNRDQALASESQLRAVAPKDRLFGVFGMLRVDEGFQAVITLDGRFQEIVSPGGQFLGRYNPLRQMKVY